VNSHALKDAKKQLKRHIRNAEATLKDVQLTISVVETQKTRFSHITPSDLYERKSLVTTSLDRLGRAKLDMSSDAIQQKMAADERAKLERRRLIELENNNNRRTGNMGNDIESNNSGNANAVSSFMEESKAQTSMLLQRQDETLDELGEAVTRVGQMAENIHQEIGHQNRMLSAMEDDLADAEEKLGMVMGKLAKFLKTKDKWQLRTIILLVFVALILFFLVLAT
jgi:syntaxin 6